MRKLLVLLAVASMLILAVSAQAVTTTDIILQLYGETNYFCSPIIPFNPHLLLPDYDIDPNGCFVEWMDGLTTQGDALNWFDPLTQSSDFFPFSWVDHCILMGDGYTAWVNGAQCNVERELHYSGVDISDTDAWVSLPGMAGTDTGGVHLVGIPYPVGTSIWWGDIIVTDGVDAYTLLDLIWVNSDYKWGTFVFQGLDASTQNSLIVPNFGEYLDGGKSYWLETTKSNLAMILPSPL